MATLQPLQFSVQPDFSIEKHRALHNISPVEAWIPAKMQWASSVGTPNGSGDLVVTFPIPFATAPSCIIVTNGERGQGPFFCGTFNNATTTQFTVRLESGAGPFIIIARINWIAIL